MSYIYTEGIDKFQLMAAVMSADEIREESKKYPWNTKLFYLSQLAEDNLSEVLHNFIINRKESNRKRLGRTPRRLWSKLKRGKNLLVTKQKWHLS